MWSKIEHIEMQKNAMASYMPPSRDRGHGFYIQA